MIPGITPGPDLEYTPGMAKLLHQLRNEEEPDNREPDLAELRDDPDVAALVARARQNEKNPPRKHHIVPGSYLRRWTEGRQLRVTEIDEHKTWITTAEKAARRTDYYSLASDDLRLDQLPPLLAETMLSDIEGLGKVSIDAEFIRDLNDGTVTVGPQNAAEVMQAFQAATRVAEILYERPWAVFKTPPILLTCDEPVVPIGRLGQDRNASVPVPFGLKQQGPVCCVTARHFVDGAGQRDFYRRGKPCR